MAHIDTSASFPGFAWKDTHATGLAEIDAQHKALFAIANDIFQHAAQNATTEALLIDLSHLRCCAVINFDTEEELMATLSLSPQHRDLHEKFHLDVIRYLDRITRLLCLLYTSDAADE